MKKIIKNISVMLMLGVVLIGCNGKEKTKENKGSKSVTELSIFAGSVPENTPTGKALKAMTNYINENSNGSLVAVDYYDTELGDGTSMVQGLQQGTIDIGVTGTSYYSGLVPEIEVYQLPFLFDSLEQARKAVDGESSKIIFDKFNDKNIVGLCFWENGFRQLTNNVKEIDKPEELKGIKLRSLPSDIQLETWKAFGAVPTTIDAGELYTALQQGTVDGEENPYHEIAARKFYEVQKYVSETNHVYTPFFMAASKNTWDKLSENQRDIIIKAAEEGKKIQREENNKSNEEAKQELIENGVKINESPDVESFKNIAKNVWHVFTDEYGSELLDIIESEK